MAYVGADVEVAIVPNSNTTWNDHTAGTIGATHGFLPYSMSGVNQKGEVFFFDSIGQNDNTLYQLVSESVEFTLTTMLHWNGPDWIFLANIVGDSTKSGTSFPVTNTMTWQREPLPALTRPAITLAFRINSDNNLIIEKPNCVVTNFTFQAIGNFLGASITLVDDTTLTGANATNGSTEFTALTYNATNSQCILMKQMQFYLIAQGSDPTGGSFLTDVTTDWNLSISRPYDLMEDVLKGYGGAQDARRRAQPIWTGEFPEVVMSYAHKTMPDAHIDDLYSANEWTAEWLLSQAIGGNTHTLTAEHVKLVPVDPNMDIERSLRLGEQMSFRCTNASAAATGQATSNPCHFIHTGNTNWTFETLSA